MVRIVGQVKILVCALNRARQSIEGDTAQHIQNLAYFEPEYAHKRYTALAQATLLSIRKHEKLGVATCLSDYYLCRALSPLLDSTDGTTEASIDTLSDKFQLQLREFQVAGLPDFFFPLRLLNSRAQQTEAVVPSLGFLKNIGIISEIGHSDEERLQFAAQACGELCFANHFELPAGLSDAMLPDLLAKFAIMELARQP